MSTATLRAGIDVDGLDDGALVTLAGEGCEAAIRVLVRRHNQRLFRTARAVLRDDAEAEDVVQETYMRAFSSLESFRREARFSTWITRIALNEALGRLRRQRPEAGLEQAEAAFGEDGGQVIMFPTSIIPPNPESESARGQVRELLERAVDELPDHFRVAFILRDVEGLSTEETASHLGIRPETVKTRLHRARRLMRAAIEARLSASFGEIFPFAGARCAQVADRVVAGLRERGRLAKASD